MASTYYVGIAQTATLQKVDTTAYLWNKPTFAKQTKPPVSVLGNSKPFFQNEVGISEDGLTTKNGLKYYLRIKMPTEEQMMLIPKAKIDESVHYHMRIE